MFNFMFETKICWNYCSDSFSFSIFWGGKKFSGLGKIFISKVSPHGQYVSGYEIVVMRSSLCFLRDLRVPNNIFGVCSPKVIRNYSLLVSAHSFWDFLPQVLKTGNFLPCKTVVNEIWLRWSMRDWVLWAKYFEKWICY